MQVELVGKYNTAQVFTENIDQETVSQVITLLNQDSIKGSKVRIMPDCHAGKGCVVGTTMTLTDKVIPNLVGVDIGCLDKDTEILTPTGWIKISEYKDEQILLYDMDADVAYFEKPNMFIKKPCKEFYHLKNTKNLDQMVSAEHHMLVFQGFKKRGRKLNHYTAEDFVTKIESLKKADNYCAKTTFFMDGAGLNYTDNDIRIFVMISADAGLKQLKNGNMYIELHFRKQRKIDRAKMLLENADIKFSQSVYSDGSTCISFSTDKFKTKDLTQFYQANQHQLNVICEECILWDGTVDEKRNHKNFFSTDKKNADLIQFAFSASGIRAVISTKNYDKLDYKPAYYVVPTGNEYVSYRSDMVEIVSSVDGYKYCFNTKTGAFVARRNNCIFVTGNCGMYAVKLKEKSIDLTALDSTINKYVPSGFSIHEEPKATSNILDMYAPVDIQNAMKSLGSLGGGNHFIEVDKDSEENLWLVIHSGSRHLGIEVCEYYQNLAYQKLKEEAAGGDIKELRKVLIESLTKEGRKKEISKELKRLNDAYKTTKLSVPQALAYVTGEDFSHYLHDMKLAQEHAKINRETIAKIIMKNMKLHVIDSFDTIHNYIDCDKMILRKGAISAQLGERVLIPMNMRDGSLICIGRGNPEWNCSAPHGAGRIMSRSQAKNNVSMKEFKHSMKGIYSTSVCESTVDEAPMVYKPMEEIMENIKDTVDVVEVIKPIYNFKAH